ncbi:uncharacterized protein METZ01_LOCUS184681, partial [marine metagenome]
MLGQCQDALFHLFHADFQQQIDGRLRADDPHCVLCARLKTASILVQGRVIAEKIVGGGDARPTHGGWLHMSQGLAGAIEQGATLGPHEPLVCIGSETVDAQSLH